jgi:hypothetical protein
MSKGTDKVEIKTTHVMTRNDAVANMTVALNALETQGDKEEVVQLAAIVLRNVASYFAATDMTGAIHDAEKSRHIQDLKIANKSLDAECHEMKARLDMADDIIRDIVKAWKANGYLKVEHRDAAKAWLQPKSRQKKGKK